MCGEMDELNASKFSQVQKFGWVESIFLAQNWLKWVILPQRHSIFGMLPQRRRQIWRLICPFITLRLPPKIKSTN